MDSALAKTKLEEPIIVHRGTGIEVFEDEDDLTNAVISDSAFVSTSMNRSVASAHADGAMIEVRVPAGARALFMDRWKVTGFDTESEILLPRGAKFRVISDNMDLDDREMVWELMLE